MPASASAGTSLRDLDQFCCHPLYAPLVLFPCDPLPECNSWKPELAACGAASECAGAGEQCLDGLCCAGKMVFMGFCFCFCFCAMLHPCDPDDFCCEKQGAASGYACVLDAACTTWAPER